MKKFFPQLAGAAIVLTAAAAGLAYAQGAGGPGASAPAVDPATDLKSNSSASRYGAGANNGSVNNPAIRSTDIKAGNVSSVDDPMPASTSTRATTTNSTPPAASSSDNGSYAPSTASGTAAPSSTNGNWNTDGTRAARADRN